MIALISRRLLVLMAVFLVGIAGVSFSQGRADKRMALPPLEQGARPYPTPEDTERWTVLHFLPGKLDETELKYIRETRRDAIALAGVRQVFLLPEGDPTALRQKLTAPLGDVKRLYVDAGGELAKVFEIESAPTVVILDPSGEVAYKQGARQGEGFLPFRSMAAQIERRWRDPRLDDMHLENGTALGGHDPVSYVTERQAQKGKPSLRSNFRGAVYLFSKPENQQAFAESPEKYLPAFGGWDAMAMADGSRVAPDPTNFRLSNGKLLLFYKGIWGDGQEAWAKDEENLMRKASTAWESGANRPAPPR